MADLWRDDAFHLAHLCWELILDFITFSNLKLNLPKIVLRPISHLIVQMDMIFT
jgi:hypothetical protein